MHRVHSFSVLVGSAGSPLPPGASVVTLRLLSYRGFFCGSSAALPVPASALLGGVEAGVAAWTATRTREEVAAACQAAGIPAGEMLTTLETETNAHFVARGFPVVIPQQGLLNENQLFDGPGFTGSRMGPVRIEQAPMIGEHTREICRDLIGMDEEEIERLVANVSLEVTPAVEKA